MAGVRGPSVFKLGSLRSTIVLSYNAAAHLDALITYNDLQICV